MSDSEFLKEAAVERYLQAQVTKRGGRSFKFVSPSYRGVPDRIVVAPYGQVWFVEVKTETGKLSKLQEIVINDLREMGAQVFVAYGKAGVDEAVAQIFQVPCLHLPELQA